jgi:DNA mismatch repair protein MutS
VTNKDIAQFENKFQYVPGSDKFTLIRRNTLKGGQRYVSDYLDSIQQKVLGAKDELTKMEFALLEEVKEKIATISKEISEFAETIAWMDLYTSHALLVKEK